MIMVAEASIAGSRDAAERAAAIVRKQARLIRIGVVAGRRIGFAAQSAAFAAMRRNRDVVGAVSSELQKMEPLIRDSMIAAHLVANNHASAQAKGIQLARPEDAYEREIAAAKKRAELSAVAINQIETTYATTSAAIVDAVALRVTGAIAETMTEIQLQGLHVRGGIELLGETFAAQGVTPAHSFTLENIFRTETQKAFSVGRWQFNQQPEIQAILWGYQYVTAGDARVRPTHAGLDGVKLPKDSPRWSQIFPPNGFSCRCQAIELFEAPNQIKAPPTSFTTTQNGKSVTVVPGADPGFAVNFGAAFPQIP